MPRKEDILLNVDKYSVEQLVTYVKEGIVTFQELCDETDGEFSATKRREVRHKLESGDSDEWNKAQTERTIEAVERYLNAFPDGQFRSRARALKKEIEESLRAGERNEAVKSAWKLVDKRSVDALSEFVSRYPDSPYAEEANKLINDLLIDDILDISADTLVDQIKKTQTNSKLTVEQKDNNIIAQIKDYITTKKISKKDFLDKLSEDHNLLSAGVVKRLIESGIIALNDLLYIRIEKPFIQKMWRGEEIMDYTDMSDLDEIHKQSTEVYFWGIPSSGKSCALGAILSVAANGRIAKSMDPDTESQGYGYMNYLINLFRDGQIGTLMGGTPIEAFHEMGFDLVDQEGKIHPITCIDMAGELMRCMYKQNANMPLEDKDLKMLDTMTNILNGNRAFSRKMHIFVIEYGAEDRLYEGYPQSVYLNGAVAYIKSTGIFKKDTDAIYIMITKVDKVKNATKDIITRYINENYLGFYNGLEQICIDNEINGKKVEKIAFSLGEVCFQNYCKFDSRPAENVVRLILKRSASEYGGKKGKFMKLFSK